MQMLVPCLGLALRSPFHTFLPSGSAFHKGTIVAFMKGKGETKTKVRRKDLEWENKKIDGNKSHGVTLFLVKGHKKPAVRLTGLIRNSDSKI